MKTLTFVTNFLTHHQIPLVEEFYKTLGDGFRVVLTAPIDRERLAMGYEDLNQRYPFCQRAYETQEAFESALRSAEQCDVLIVGSGDDAFLSRRLTQGKLTFKYSERFFKKGLSLLHLPRAYFSARKHLTRYERYPLFFLCSSAYTAADVNTFSDFRGKTYKWGYFPRFQPYEDISSLIRSKEKNTILWAARFIDCKHPEACVKMAAKLKASNIAFMLRMIGSGVLIDETRKAVARSGLTDCVTFLGSVSPDEVRTYMERSEIFLFTSDFNEGWGAVVNEAMNSGCGVLASHAAGSVPFLLRHGENGLIYRSGDDQDLLRKIRYWIENPERRAACGENAYRTLQSTWNAVEAANRFILLSEELLARGQCDLFCDGPCSRAEIMSNNWFRE